jgi:hypothetical protein
MAAADNGLSGVPGGLDSPRGFEMSPWGLTQHRIHRHLIGCLVLALVGLLSPAALAHTLVPMCGAHAESIAAPPPMRAGNDASIDAPCSSPEELLKATGTPKRTPDQVAQLEAPQRLAALYYRLPPRSQAHVLLIASDGGAERAGFRRCLDRPPR